MLASIGKLKSGRKTHNISHQASYFYTGKQEEDNINQYTKVGYHRMNGNIV